MIVRDEAHTLPRCLASVRGFVDEIVVADTGSVDGTPEIARAHGGRVVPFAWCDDFAAARNESLRHATGDWILVLDADESLTDGSGPALRRAVAAAAPDVVGYLVKILCPREGDGGMVRLNWFPRLFRRLPGVRFEGVIHEQIVGTLGVRGRIERSEVAALHTGYALPPAEMEAKSRRNLALLERQLRDDPTYAPGWFQLGETCVLMGRVDEGIDAYRRCLRLLDTSRLTLPPAVIAVALQNLGAALLSRGDRQEGIEHIEAALAIAPDLAPAHVHLGQAALADQDWPRAERHFAAALVAAETGSAATEYQVSPWLMHLLAGCARARQDRLGEAIASFESGLRLNPDHRETLWLLALTAGKSGDWSRSLAALERLASLGRDDWALHAQRALALAALERHAEAARAAEQALAAKPDAAPMQALLAESLARAGRPDEAARAYERLLARAPDSTGAWLALAQCREAAGDPEAMMRAYERAVALAPDSPDVLFALGSACLRIDALDAAEECLAAAVDRAPERPDYRVNHALCLLKRGAIGAARDALAHIAARWPDRPETRQLDALLARLAALHAAPLASAPA
jgi:tetratricopeptide (TPR) repeat protein